jgi:Trypsin-like peptidase domain
MWRGLILKVGKSRRALVCGMFPLAVLSGGCKEKFSGLSYSSYIIGPTNDIKPLDASTETDVIAKVMRSTVLVTTKRATGAVKFCTGSLIAPEDGQESPRVVTNHHCFAEIDPAGLATDKLMPEACAGTLVFVDFNHTTDYRGEEIECASGSLRTSAVLDLAVFTLARKVSRPIEPLEFYKGDESGIHNRQALIIHYPSQSKETVKSARLGVALPEESVTSENCTALGMFADDEKRLDPILGVGIRHSCDLVHGSSGSALIDQESGVILGVNWGGIKIQRGSELVEVNVATAASYAADFVARRAISVAGESDAIAAHQGVGDQANAASGDAATKKSLVGQAKRRLSCGSVDMHGFGSGRWAQMWMALLFLFPLICQGLLRNTRKM